METIVLQNACMGYLHREVLHDVSLSLKAGQLTCLIGPNGAGKSTFLRTLCGFLPLLSGEIGLHGRPLQQISIRQMARIVSIVLTQRPDLAHMSVGEVIAMGRTPYSNFWGRLRESDQQAVDEALRMTGLQPLTHRQIQTLSDGEFQKVMIAKSLAQHTPVMLLDEPTAFLDYPSKVETMRLLSQLATETGKTVLVSTHDLELALSFAHMLLYVDNGCVEEVSKKKVRTLMGNLLEKAGAEGQSAV